MCGFYFSKTNLANYNFKEQLDKFNKIKHRGVDHSSYLEIKDKSYYFIGHHRLAINDLNPRSNQPFVSNCKNIYLLFNGEIFNHSSLSKSIDYNFITTSDTEVIMAGYKQQGEKFFKKLEGFFSILIIDFYKNLIIATVDPTSFKNMYYKVDNDSISFSSELSCLEPKLTKLNLKKKLSTIGLQHYLQYGFIHAPNTIYNNIYKLEPGELIKIDLLKNSKKNIKSFNKLVKKNNYYPNSIINHLIESHKSRLMSDTPIAHFLSSGVDSTLSCAIYEHLYKSKLYAYTLGLKDSLLDESALAKKQINKLNINHKVKLVDKNLIFSEYHSFVKFIDEPFGDLSIILVSLLSKEISKKFKVAISSDGGDELIFGYARHKFFYLLKEVYRLPRILKILIKFFINSNFMFKILEMIKIRHLSIKINKINSFLESNKLSNAYLHLLKVVPDVISKDLFLLWSKDNNISYDSKTSDISRIIKEIDYRYYIPMINYKNDRAGMHHGLEIREPMLNHDIISVFFNIKFSLKHFLFPKYFFKKILNKLYKIKIVSRKHGFSFSQNEILEFNDYKVINDLENNLPLLEGIFDTNLIKTYICLFKKKGYHSTELVLLSTLNLWLLNKINNSQFTK